MKELPKPEDVLAFWFKELSPKQHFLKDEVIDRLIEDKFGALHADLCENHNDFAANPCGKLAAIIVFDQFSRNMFRGSNKAFANDEKALRLAKDLVVSGDDLIFTKTERVFLYMPFMHAESLEDQEQSVMLYNQLGEETNLDYAQKHLEVIKHFGRFPHRNTALGRISTEAEKAFINTPGTVF